MEKLGAYHPQDLTRHSREARPNDDGRAGTAENCTVPAFCHSMYLGLSRWK
jgi:hypothetical protein